MNYVIVTGHGGYASGMRSSLEAIAGEQKHYIYIDYDTCLSAEALRMQYEEAMRFDLEGNYLFACDVAGATPYQMAALMAVHNPKIQVVGGVNLSALLEVIFHLDESITKLAETMIQTTKQTAILFKLKKRL